MVTYLTAAGNTLMNSVIGDEAVLNFTKIQFGNGTDWETEDITELRAQISAATALFNEIKEIEFDDQDGSSVTIDPVSGLALLKASFQNLLDDTGWHVTEIGIFAQQGEDTSTEVLYAVSAVDVSQSAWVPPNEESVATFDFGIYVYVGDVADVTAVLKTNATVATEEALNDHIQKRNNPHVVTKEQVELGNVPNVTTNNQRPYFTEASTFSNIDGSSQTNPQTGETEGVETLSTILGKIKKAIAEFILHRDNKNNPHETTAAQIGAAAVKHYHDASVDINKGSLPAARGGTESTFDEDTPLKNSENCAVTLWTELSAGKLLKQGGYVNVDGKRLWVPFEKEFKDTRYTLTFQTSGNSFIPLWRNVEKYTTGFYMNRTIGIDTSKFKSWAKSLFPFNTDIQNAIDEWFGASQAADWIAVGQAK